MLNYDDSAFHYFALCSLSCYLAPSWYIIASRLYRAFASTEEDIEVARTSVEIAKTKTLKSEQSGFHVLKNKSFLTFATVTSLLTALAAIVFAACVSEENTVNSFDPFVILGVDPGASKRTIAKAYRRLSKTYHPDQCVLGPECEPSFLLVNSAYKSLTDPEAIKNFEKCGNPDCGSQGFEFGLGLPAFLVDEAYHNLVLLTYLVILVGIIPVCVWRYYSDSCKIGDKGIACSSYSWYNHNLSEHTLVKSMPEILAGSAEFRTLNNKLKASEKEEIMQMKDMLKSKMQRPKFFHDVCVKGNVLLHAHLCRKASLLSEKLQADLKHMLSDSFPLIEAMITVCKNQNSLKTALHCIKFGQLITQAMWVKDSPLLQLPHFTNEEIIKHCSKSPTPCKTVLKFSQLADDDERRELKNFTDVERSDVQACCAMVPDLNVQSAVFVDDDDDDRVYEGDICTVKVLLTRENLETGARVPMVHAPHFPLPIPEAWWVVLGTKDGNILHVEKVTSWGRVNEHEIKFLAPSPGEYELDLHVLSSAYVGLDQKQTVNLVVYDASCLADYKIHPDDAKLDEEATLFEEMMKGKNVEDDSDSDDEEEETLVMT